MNLWSIEEAGSWTRKETCERAPVNWFETDMEITDYHLTNLYVPKSPCLCWWQDIRSRWKLKCSLGRHLEWTSREKVLADFSKSNHCKLAFYRFKNVYSLKYHPRLCFMTPWVKIFNYIKLNRLHIGECSVRKQITLRMFTIRTSETCKRQGLKGVAMSEC